MNKKTLKAIAFTVALMLTGCSQFPLSSKERAVMNQAIDKFPSVLELKRSKLDTIPNSDKYYNDYLQVDLRSYDLTNLYLKNNFENLQYATFNNKTRWPYSLPDGFNPKKILECGKNPGLNVRNLNKEGITGKGIGIAIIDGALLVDHIEYKDRIIRYEEINCQDNTATESGCASASALAGKNIGIVPESEIYYIATTPGSYVRGNLDIDLTKIIDGVERVIEINQSLPEKNKIRVLLIGFEMSISDKGYSELFQSLKKARDNGIFVVYNLSWGLYDEEFHFDGLGRNLMDDPDYINSYKPAYRWSGKFYLYSSYPNFGEQTLVPMDQRTVASPTGKKDYTFYPISKLNLASSYLGGVFALACQINPEINPHTFWKLLLETSDSVTITNGDLKQEYKLKGIINPVKLIEKIKMQL